ncbi:MULTISPECIES: lycopene cyclase family protein [Streptomyces]|uniref:Lycopene cyclase family protein n=1 Tax=Streptomyces thermogriseus TaxID=75292 RepID=A0ABN1T385_9ACTN|nr:MULTISPECIES: lycopene cyclase family protein [Streptomyces]MDN5383160.1 lycopene cyclase family protein [Streptomyces sp. LB8]
MLETDVAIVGAGAAGWSLAHWLARRPPGARPVSVVLLEAPPGPLRPPERTWCYWEPRTGPYDAALTTSWRRLRVHAPDGHGIERDIAPLRYKMLRSDDFASFVARLLADDPDVLRLQAAVETVEPADDGAEVRARTAGGRPVLVRARWVFDSRPPRSLPAARTTLLQHFHGWFVRHDRPVFDPGTVEFMDFRTPQPEHGLSFGYVLPTGRRHALVEYTEFSSQVLTREEYEAALRRYTAHVLRLGRFEVTGTESGVIPMTDAVFARQSGPSVFRIGAASGATRPSTGYTFTAVQRQTRAVAAALHAGRHPLPPPPHRARARAMDAVLLHALDSGRVDGPAFFTRLFRRVPVRRLLCFLDGRTRLHEDLSIGLHTPVLPMLRSALELPRLPRRSFPAPDRRHPRPSDPVETVEIP